MRIAIDAMSGDNGLDAVIPAIKSIIDGKHIKDDAKIIIVGNQDEIQQYISKKYSQSSNNIFLNSNIEIIHANEVVTMDESPVDALRYKKDSSMRVAINLVKSGMADACVSAGNTGALMAISKFVLKTVEGIDRPAIATNIPSHKGSVLMLDLGANIHCSPENLYQFALMGSILKQIEFKDSNYKPKVALLNIGEELLKGPDTIRRAQDLIKENSDINYIGFIESNNIHNDIADVIVTDGFSGNIALKTIEGLSKFIIDILKDEYKKTIYAKLMAVLAYPVFKRIKNKLDSRRYNGASLLGLNGIVIKSHGGADEVGFKHAILKAIDIIDNNIIYKLRKNSEEFVTS